MLAFLLLWNKWNIQIHNLYFNSCGVLKLLYDSAKILIASTRVHLCRWLGNAFIGRVLALIGWILHRLCSQGISWLVIFAMADVQFYAHLLSLQLTSPLGYASFFGSPTDRIPIRVFPCEIESAMRTLRIQSLKETYNIASLRHAGRTLNFPK